jgi:hypothetical protein
MRNYMTNWTRKKNGCLEYLPGERSLRDKVETRLSGYDISSCP